jgi:ubiquitin-protein ligase
MRKVIKRIMNIDIKNISNANLSESGIYIKFNEENIMKAEALIIGPKDSIYENGYLIFEITFPNNYPFSPPLLLYKSINKIRIHPNIYVNGKVCLSILGTWNGPSWTSAMDITNVLITIQSILGNNPITNEPGYENVLNSPKGKKINDSYNKIIDYNTYNSLIYNNLYYKENTLFNEEITKHYLENKKKILERLNNRKNISPEICNSIYGLKQNINYNILYNKFLNLKI